MVSHLLVAGCKEYDEDYIYSLIKNYFDDNLEQKEKLVRSKQVLIKPNLCLAQPPEKAITTHPVIIEQLVKYILDNGIQPLVGENPIGDINESDFMDLIKITGIYDVLKKYNCRYILLGAEGITKKELIISNSVYNIPVSNEYLQSDYVINVPKFKTHGLTGFTGAVKNIFGTVFGKYKACIHTYAKSIDDFNKTLLEIYSLRTPDLNIMDAIEGLSGNGPGTKGDKKKISLLLFGNDGILMDNYCTNLIGLTNDSITVKQAGICKDTVNKETYYRFNSSTDFKLCDFELPTIYKSSNVEVRNKLYDLHKYKIKIDYNKCKTCYLCRDNCPKKCLKINELGLFVEVKNCILCLCCMEICPHEAIDITTASFYIDLKSQK
jgi:uncharacterized protein (DUF362 family)/NAD-dependent dihydropyrimidine dehydrogenase PreA subunit